MQLKEVITPDITVCNDAYISNKKQVLEAISKLACKTDAELKNTEILSALQQRERIGSTVIGHGIAIPHARISNLKKPLCILLTLKNTINFDLDDPATIDVVFGLLVPQEATEEHLALLAQLSKKLQQKELREKIRQAKSSAELYHIITHNPEEATDAAKEN